MKTKNFRTKNLNSRLVAYSATATAAILIVPAAKATIQNITIADVSSNGVAGAIPVLTSGTLSFGAGPLNASFTGFLGNYAELVGNFAINGGGHVIHFAGNNNTQIEGLNFPNGGRHAFYTTVGPVNGAITGYVGFKTQKNAQTYYGWLRVQENFGTNGAPTTLKLIDNGNGIFGAYGTTSDNVWVGQIVATPEPSVAALGGLALLACGAAGVREMRRRRQTETVKA
jgi:hypothetical protein